MNAIDTPGLSTIQFLYTVMLDRRLPLTLGIRAADMLMQTGHGNKSVVQAMKGKLEVRRRIPEAGASKPPAKSAPPMSPDYVAQRLRSIHIATINGVQVA